MPRTTPLPTVEFRSLLSPPIRAPLRALQSLNRPPCRPSASRVASPPQCLAQRRSLNLYITARSKTVLGMHKVVPFDLYEPPEPSASEHKVNLVNNEKDLNVIAADMSLQDLYENHIKPGHMLYLAREIRKSTAQKFEMLKELNIPAQARDYTILKARSTNANTKKAQFGELKCIHVALASPIPYFKLSLDRAYQFIDGGSPVEFHIRMKGSYVSKEKVTAGPPDVWPWMHNHFPHLRPDFILKSMPEGTIYLIKPVCDGKQVEFVMAKPSKKMPQGDLTERLMKVKGAVRQAIRGNAPIQLPKGVRERLLDTWEKESDGLEGERSWGYKGRKVTRYEAEDGQHKKSRNVGRRDDKYRSKDNKETGQDSP